MPGLIMEMVYGEKRMQLNTLADLAAFEAFYAEYKQFTFSESKFLTGGLSAKKVVPLSIRQPVQMTRKRSSPRPQSGERTIDYLLTALVSSDTHSLPLKELPAKMKAYGWKTKVQKASVLASTISTMCRRHSDWVSVEDGQATITEQGQRFLNSQ